jgi:hypothetical protein
MKNTLLFALGFMFLTLSLSCDKCDENVDIVQPVLFQYEHVNHAWLYTHVGWMIDGNGDVKGFNLPEKWTFPDSDGFISKSDLQDNLNQTDTVFYSVSKDELLDHFDDRFDLLDARIDTSDTYMADAGMSVLSVYIWDLGKEMYKKQVLKTKGDLQLTNSHPKTKPIVDWLVKIGKNTDNFYWGF